MGTRQACIVGNIANAQDTAGSWVRGRRGQILVDFDDVGRVGVPNLCNRHVVQREST